MKQKKRFLIFMVISTLILTACTNTTGPDNDESQLPDPPVNELEEGPEVPDSQEEEPVLIQVEPATEDLLSAYDAYDEFLDSEEDYAQEIIFTTNVPVEDFSFIKVASEDVGNDVAFHEEEVLYIQDELTPEKPLLIHWVEQGTLPHRGITFIDESGSKRSYTLSSSGEDGTLLLIEFTNESE